MLNITRFSKISLVLALVCILSLAVIGCAADAGDDGPGDYVAWTDEDGVRYFLELGANDTYTLYDSSANKNVGTIVVVDGNYLLYDGSADGDGEEDAVYLKFDQDGKDNQVIVTGDLTLGSPVKGGFLQSTITLTGDVPDNESAHFFIFKDSAGLKLLAAGKGDYEDVVLYYVETSNTDLAEIIQVNEAAELGDSFPYTWAGQDDIYIIVVFDEGESIFAYVSDDYDSVPIYAEDGTGLIAALGKVELSTKTLTEPETYVIELDFAAFADITHYYYMLMDEDSSDVLDDAELIANIIGDN